MYEVGSRCALCGMYVCLCLIFATVCISITYTVSLVGGMKKRMSQPGPKPFNLRELRGVLHPI